MSYVNKNGRVLHPIRYTFYQFLLILVWVLLPMFFASMLVGHLGHGPGGILVVISMLFSWLAAPDLNSWILQRSPQYQRYHHWSAERVK